MMTSEERMYRFYAGKSIDHVPYITNATMHAGYQMGLTSWEFYQEVEKCYSSQKIIRSQYHCDGSPCLDIPNGELLDLGGNIEFDQSGPVSHPRQIYYAINTLEDALQFEIPVISEMRYLQKRKDFLNYAICQGDTAVSISGGSPLSILSSIMNPNLLFRLIRKEPNLFKTLLTKIEDYLILCAIELISCYKLENCSVFSNFPMESGSMFSSVTYEKLLFPSILSTHERLCNLGLRNFGIHLCGDHSKTVSFFKELHLPDRSLITLDERNNLREFSDILGHQYIYGGNVPSSLLILGSPADVYQYSVSTIQEMKNNEGGFFLCPSCDLPIDANPQNMMAMYQAVMHAGQYTCTSL